MQNSISEFYHDTSEIFSFYYQNINTTKVKEIDNLIIELSKKYTHTLIAIGFTGNRHCYIDESYSSSDTLLRLKLSEQDYIDTNYDVLVMGFNSYFPAYCIG